jgi:hypothetical protein
LIDDMELTSLVGVSNPVAQMQAPLMPGALGRRRVRVLLAAGYAAFGADELTDGGLNQLLGIDWQACAGHPEGRGDRWECPSAT